MNPGQEEKAASKNLRYGFFLALIVAGAVVVLSRGCSSAVRVEALAVSPDGKTLAVSLTGFRNELSAVPEISNVRHWLTLRKWSGGRLIDVELDEEAEAIAFSPRGDFLATGHRDGMIRLRDTRTGKVVKGWEAHRDTIWSLDFDRDGSSLASGGMEDGTAKVWSVPGGELRATMAHDDWVTAVSFSPTGRHLATGCRDSMVRIWDVREKRLSATLAGHEDGVIDIDYSHDGKRIASGGWDKALMIWDVAAGKPEHRRTGFASEVCAVTFSPDDTLVAAGTAVDLGGTAAPGSIPECSVTLFRSADGGVVRSLKGHTGRIEGVVFSPDGSELCSGGGTIAWQSTDGSVRTWRIPSGTAKDRFYPGRGNILVPLLLVGAVFALWLRQWRRAIRAGQIQKPFRTFLIALGFLAGAMIVTIAIGYVLIMG